MSSYTTEVRFICETEAGLTESAGYSRVNEVIAKSRAKIFDFAYPIYDESYRSVLETKILKHFYTREIGAETVGLWKLWLDARMNEIMPYFNQLYQSATIKFDPMLDVDITTKRNADNKGNRVDNGSRDISIKNNSSSKATGDAWDYYNDTPQGGISGIDSLKYLTNVTHDTSTNNNNATQNYENNEGSNSNSVYANTEDYLERVTGKRSGISYSKMLQEYRETIINIDEQIIDRLNDLFMGLW